jgi:hypothetical protein
LNVLYFAAMNKRVYIWAIVFLVLLGLNAWALICISRLDARLNEHEYPIKRLPLSQFFIAMPGMTRDECRRELGMLNFKRGMGYGGEAWNYTSDKGESLTLCFNRDDRLYLVTCGISEKSWNTQELLGLRPLICDAKIRWMMDVKEALKLLYLTGLYVDEGKERSSGVWVMDSADTEVLLHSNSGGKLTAISLSRQDLFPSR